MFKHIRSAITARVDHPILFLMYLLAALFGVAAGLVEVLIRLEMTGWAMGAAFLGVYMIFFAAIGTIGYSILFLMTVISQALDRVGPTA